MRTEFTGIIHGQTIELNEAPGLPDGQAVTIILQPTNPQGRPDTEAIRAALLRAAGSWCDDVEGLDRYLEWSRQQRKVNRPELSE